MNVGKVSKHCIIVSSVIKCTDTNLYLHYPKFLRTSLTQVKATSLTLEEPISQTVHLILVILALQYTSKNSCICSTLYEIVWYQIKAESEFLQTEASIICIINSCIDTRIDDTYFFSAHSVSDWHMLNVGLASVYSLYHSQVLQPPLPTSTWYMGQVLLLTWSVQSTLTSCPCLTHGMYSSLAGYQCCHSWEPLELAVWVWGGPNLWGESGAIITLGVYMWVLWIGCTWTLLLLPVQDRVVVSTLDPWSTVPKFKSPPGYTMHK